LNKNLNLSGRIATVVFSGGLLFATMIYVAVSLYGKEHLFKLIPISDNRVLATSIFLAISYSLGSLIRTLPTNIIDKVFLPHKGVFPYYDQLRNRVPKLTDNGLFDSINIEKYLDISEGDYKLMKSVVIQRSDRLSKHLELFEESVRLIIGYLWASMLSFIVLILYLATDYIFSISSFDYLNYAFLSIFFVIILICSQSIFRARTNEIVFTIYAYISVKYFHVSENNTFTSDSNG